MTLRPAPSSTNSDRPLRWTHPSISTRSVRQLPPWRRTSLSPLRLPTGWSGEEYHQLLLVATSEACSTASLLSPRICQQSLSQPLPGSLRLPVESTSRSWRISLRWAHFFSFPADCPDLHSFPPRRSSD